MTAERKAYWGAWAAVAAALVCLFLHARVASLTLFGLAAGLGIVSGRMNPLTLLGLSMCGYTLFFDGMLLWCYAGVALTGIGVAIHD